MAKFVILVMDSVGVGEMPDAARFGDEGSNTIGNIIKQRGKLDVPHMVSLGLGNIEGTGIPYHADKPLGSFGKCAERFQGKDTTGGHWEIAGLVLDNPFPTYPDGFPARIMDEFERQIGRGTLGNYPESGTVIIEKLGDEHVRTGKPIVYTSADSVFQIAMHEKIIPLEEQYEICLKARAILTGDDLVGRVIARPFEGGSGQYVRTKNRKDFSVTPPKDTIMDAIKAAGLEVAGVGKIEDIFANRGLTKSNHTTSNDDGVQATIDYIGQDFNGLVFSNLVDFDMLYGHRNNVEGYAQALERLDTQLPAIMQALGDEDILIVTADHGCDPTTTSTDHSREYIPLLVYGKACKSGVNLGIRSTFADIAATAADFFGLAKWEVGTSFLPEIK